MKKLILAVVLLSALNCYAQAGSLYFMSKLDTILKYSLFDSTQIAISVYDLRDGKSIYERNEKLLVRPGSTLKIFTTAAALQFLKADYNLKTNLYLDKPVTDSVYTGNIYIEGGFDPEFSISGIETFVSALKNLGIKKITGNIYADISKMDSLFWSSGWMWDDDPGKFVPYMNSLPVNKNSIMVITSPAKTGESAQVKTVPETGFVKITNKAKTIEAGDTHILVTRNWVNRKNDISVDGVIGIAGKPDTTEVNLVHPEKYLQTLFVEALKRNSIQFNGITDTLKTPAGIKLIGTVSHPLPDVLKATNKPSDNLNGEMLLRLTAYEQLKRKVSATDGIKYIDSLLVLSGIKKKNYQIVDGSGVSFYNLITCSMMIEILKYIYANQEMYDVMLNSFPIAGVDGTLAKRMKEFSTLQSVKAKTGTLRGVSNLAGYITTVHKHVMAFAIYIQNFTGDAKRIRDIQDQICNAIYLIKSDKDE